MAAQVPYVVQQQSRLAHVRLTLRLAEVGVKRRGDVALALFHCIVERVQRQRAVIPLKRHPGREQRPLLFKDGGNLVFFHTYLHASRRYCGRLFRPLTPRTGLSFYSIAKEDAKTRPLLSG